jgi:hypothetical protein
MVMSHEDLPAFLPVDALPADVGQLASQSCADEPAHLETLRTLGWTVELRNSYWLASRGHRRIELYRDGRVIFKDPTIRARYQFDDEWLKIIRFVWPDVQF